MNDTITTENLIPAGYTEARHEIDPESEVILRVEDLKDGMVVLVESMITGDNPAKAEDPDCDKYVLERLKKYQTWRRVTELKRSGYDTRIVSWVGVDANGRGKSQKYGIGHFFFVKKSSMPETYPQPYLRGVYDLAKIIAQETSGITGAIPEQDDYNLAREFVKKIEERN
jgi:hypothetical protein